MTSTARKASDSQPTACWRQLPHVPDLLALARAQPDEFPYLLESAAAGTPGRHSLLMFASPQKLLAGPDNSEDFFAQLAEWQRRESMPDSAEVPGLPFTGGWFIYLGYEMAASVEPSLDLPANRTGLPDAIAHRCPGAIVLQHGDGSGDRTRAIAVAETPELLDHLLALAHRTGESGSDGGAGLTRGPESIIEEDPRRFKGAVERIHGYLKAGDVFQVNVSRAWNGRFGESPDPYRVYDALRRANPAPFAGLMRWGGRFVLSSSPERLVEIRGHTVQTRPIAGTRPRGADTGSDENLARELIGDLKERAEHIMLIDLERNDLGRICRPGSIEVNELMVIESHAHVHHIVSNVRGELAADAGPVDAMRAVFPGGTITGCPKVRCMEIIAELEGEGRGFYTGSMGYLDRNGNLDLNILIRSMLLHGREFSFRTGAGIVADSAPERECEETADKARGLLLALQARGGEKAHA